MKYDKDLTDMQELDKQKQEDFRKQSQKIYKKMEEDKEYNNFCNIVLNYCIKNNKL